MLRNAVEVARALSLDVVCGVLGGAALAVAVTGAVMPWAWWWVLPAATWVVYSTDRLLDARRVGAGAHSHRHRFYHRHAWTLKVCTAVVGASTVAGALLFLPLRTLVGGAALGGLSAAYLLAAQRCRSRWFPKEVVAASVYVAGIWLGPIAANRGLNRWIVLAVMLHGLAALLNLWVFAWFERDVDELDGHGSIACSWGERATRRWLVVLTLAGSCGVAVGVAGGPPRLVPAMAVMFIVIAAPWAMQRFNSYFAAGFRYRLFGDLAFVFLALPSVLHHTDEIRPTALDAVADHDHIPEAVRLLDERNRLVIDTGRSR